MEGVNTVNSGDTDLSDADQRPKICLFGAGNVAFHLAKAFSRIGRLTQVVSRHIESAQRIAAIAGPDCEAITDLSRLSADARYYIIAVNDDAIAGIVGSTPDFPGVWAHTSGSVPIEVFNGKKSNFGVFYPLQTFTRDLDVDISRVPFFIEGDSRQSEAQLMSLAGMISGKVLPADSCRRRLLHVAAVFACNFANLMWMEADTLLRTEGLDIKSMLPLLETTLRKLSSLTPYEAQTGPARRGDREVIARHIAMLPENQRKIYALLSDEILNRFHPGDGAS